MLFFAGLIRIGPGAQGQPGGRRRGGERVQVSMLSAGERCGRMPASL